MRLRLFYGCSYMLHLSGDNSRNLFSHLLLSKLFCSDTWAAGESSDTTALSVRTVETATPCLIPSCFSSHVQHCHTTVCHSPRTHCWVLRQQCASA